MNARQRSAPASSLLRRSLKALLQVQERGARNVPCAARPTSSLSRSWGNRARQAAQRAGLFVVEELKAKHLERDTCLVRPGRTARCLGVGDIVQAR